MLVGIDIVISGAEAIAKAESVAPISPEQAGAEIKAWSCFQFAGASSNEVSCINHTARLRWWKNVVAAQCYTSLASLPSGCEGCPCTHPIPCLAAFLLWHVCHHGRC